jgi:hypothetical protein
MRDVDNPPNVWTGQFLHCACVVILLICVWSCWVFINKPYPLAFWAAISFPVVHQVFVWLSWRLELQASKMTRTIGFQGYVVSFFFLFSGRFISLIVLACLDQGSLNLRPIPQSIATVICILLGLYAMYSVKRYFGMSRAAGADHFDSAYRTMPLVKEGIFRFTSNAMYVYAFLLFWSIAIGLNSKAALLVAAFSHVYIWVHYYATEKPDMEYIYNSKSNHR